MARSSRSTSVVAPSAPVLSLELPELTTLTAEVAKDKNKFLWKEEAFAFINHINDKLGYSLELVDVQQHGAFYFEFEKIRPSIRAQLNKHHAALRAAREAEYNKR
jgi:hypothetical protein